jgi:hypothetical protein
MQAVCSCEHENLLISSLGANTAELRPETKTAGVRPVDATLKALKAALEAVRDTAMNALRQIERPQEQHSMRWKCKQCR